LKYHCDVCDCDHCFDGTTDETLPADIKQHEYGSLFHRDHLEKNLRDEIISQKKLLDAYQKQFDRELSDNNGLRESIMIYSKAFEKIEALAFGEEGEWVDIVNKISKDLHEAILKK
jgi:hypothetical protein